MTHESQTCKVQLNYVSQTMAAIFDKACGLMTGEGDLDDEAKAALHSHPARSTASAHVL